MEDLEGARRDASENVPDHVVESRRTLCFELGKGCRPSCAAGDGTELYMSNFLSVALSCW